MQQRGYTGSAADKAFMVVTVTNERATGPLYVACRWRSERRILPSRQQYFHSGRAHKPWACKENQLHLFESKVKLNYMRKLNSYLTENKTLCPLLRRPFKQILVRDKYPQLSFLTIRTVKNAVKTILIVKFTSTCCPTHSKICQKPKSQSKALPHAPNFR